MSVVMVVEDEPILRDSMVRSLRRLPGIEVVEAARFAEARRLVVDERPALLVSDLSLPDASGLGLLAELDAAALTIPVIFITAYIGRYRDQIPNRTGVEVFEKPLPMGTLRDMVLRQLEANRHRLRPPFTLPEYLQMAALGRHSVLIRVSRDGSSQGWVRLVGGDLWSARCGELRGERAVCGLTFMSDTRIEVEHLEGQPGTREIHAPVEAILLDAFRILDEAQRDQRLSVDEVLAALDASTEEAFSLGTMPSPPQPPEPVDEPEFPSRLSRRSGRRSERRSGIRRAQPPKPIELKAEIPADPPKHPSPSAAELRFERLLEDGREAIFLRHYDRALIAFEEAARLQPDHPGVQANLDRLRRRT